MGAVLQVARFSSSLCAAGAARSTFLNARLGPVCARQSRQPEPNQSFLIQESTARVATAIGHNFDTNRSDPTDVPPAPQGSLLPYTYNARSIKWGRLVSPLITYALMIAFSAAGILAVFDGWNCRRGPLFWLEAFCLIVAFLILRWQVGFPAIRESFSATPSPTAVLVMFFFVLLGTAANYFFQLKGTFSWSSFARPLVVSPLVLLPLLGTLQGRSELDGMQLIWFALLAFQNGFFWRVVYDRAKPTAKSN